MTEEILLDKNIIDPNKYLAAGKSSSNARSLEYLPAKPNWFSRLIGWFKGCHPASNLNRIIHHASKIAQATFEHSSLSKNYIVILQRNLSYLHSKAENHNKNWLVRLISIFTKKILCNTDILQKLEQQIHELEKIKQNLAAQPQAESIEKANVVQNTIAKLLSAEQGPKPPIESKPYAENAKANTKEISKQLSSESASKETSNLVAAEILLPAMLECLSPKLSTESLILAGQIKFNLGKFNEAEIYFDQAIIAHKNAFSFEALAMAAEVKYHLKKWTEAEELYSSASRLQKFLTGRWVFPLKNLNQMAEIKYRLKKWKEADNLYDEVVEGYKEAYRKKTKDAPSTKELLDILSKAAFVNTCLKQYYDAANLFDYMVNLEKKGDTFVWPAKILNAAATAYYEEGHYRDAEEFAKSAIESYGEKIPADVLFQASLIKKALEKYDEAEKLIDQIVALSAAGHTISANMLHEMALAKKEHGKLEEAEELINKAIAAVDHSSPQLVYDAALIKYALKKYDIAEQNMKVAESDFVNTIPLNFHYHFALIKKELNKLDEAEELFKKAIQGYMIVSNIWLLKDAADLKHQLKKYAEAEPLYDQAITQASAENQKLPAQSLYKAAITKYQLKKYKESELLMYQAESAFDTQIPANFYYDAGIIKKFCNNPNASFYFDKAFKAYLSAKLIIPADLFYQNAEAKYTPKNVKEAEPYIDGALTAYGNKIPVYVLTLAGKIKYTLQKFTEADQLISKAMGESGEQISLDILYTASMIKKMLKDWSAAELLDDKIIEIIKQAKKNNFPPDFIHSVLVLKMNLNKYQEAEALYDQAITAYGLKVSASMLNCYVKIKFMLKKYEEAENILEKAMVSANANDLVIFLASMMEVKINLKKFTDVESIFEKIRAIPDQKISPHTLHVASSAKFHLKKLEEAEKLIDQAIADQSVPITPNILIDAAVTKKQLGKLEELNLCMQKP